MKKKIIVICGILILCVSRIASAGQESGLYIGGSIGSANIDVSKDSFDFDDDDLGYKLFAGYNFGVIPLIDLGIEGSYVDFGGASSGQISDQNVDITGWDVFGLAAVNLGPIGLFGKVGQIWWDSDSDFPQGQLDDSDNNMAYGLGLRFQIGSLAVRAEYEIFDLDVGDVEYLSAGVSWTF